MVFCVTPCTHTHLRSGSAIASVHRETGEAGREAGGCCAWPGRRVARERALAEGGRGVEREGHQRCGWFVAQAAPLLPPLEYDRERGWRESCPKQAGQGWVFLAWRTTRPSPLQAREKGSETGAGDEASLLARLSCEGRSAANHHGQGD